MVCPRPIAAVPPASSRLTIMIKLIYYSKASYIVALTIYLSWVT